mmetsp:Transcript_5214/g.15239  ORF Transcript_5214/g.15239 Transcript_5214/m.15239 type:complete len:223 (-) Transcript_5214:2239-2907(-)
MLKFLACLVAAVTFPTVAAGSPRFKLSGNPTCSSGRLSFNIKTECSDDCSGGDKVIVSGTAKATGDFDGDAKVTLQACVTGPMGMVSFYCPDDYKQDAGSVCDWISSDTVSCGSAASDYVVSNEVKIPKAADQIQSSSFTSIKIKALIDGSDACEETGSAYSMAFSIVGAVALVGGAYAVRRRRRAMVSGGDDDRRPNDDSCNNEPTTKFVEMQDTTTSSVV